MELSVQKLSPNAVLPSFATSGSAGLDLRACLDAPLTLERHSSGAQEGRWSCVKVPTGLAMAIPEGHVGLIFARSGLATKHGLTPANCVGVIDSDYRGEIVVALINLGAEDYVIQPGERIAQMVIVPCVQPTLIETEALPETDRGAGGFGSPRRKELLTQMGLTFRVVVSDVDETVDASLSPAQQVALISRRKAQAVAETVGPEALVVAADTIVALTGEVMGKPHSRAQAVEMLTRLSSQTHAVYTGFTLQRGEQVVTETERTAVTFRALTPQEIDAYVDTGEPMDKAGAYGIQGLGSLLIQGIEGDYFNVMGLPVCRLGQALKTFGLDPMKKG